MNHTLFAANAKIVIENHWRIKAALKILKPADFRGLKTLHYANIPQTGNILNLNQEETIADALDSLNAYASNRLTIDTFTVLIGEFESRLNFFLRTTPESPGGTLGTIQRKVEKIRSMPLPLVEGLDEIRERRNTMQHDQGIAGQKYLDAATKVASRAAPFVSVVPLGTNVTPTGAYLTYCADVMISYSQQL